MRSLQSGHCRNPVLESWQRQWRNDVSDVERRVNFSTDSSFYVTDVNTSLYISVLDYSCHDGHDRTHVIDVSDVVTSWLYVNYGPKNSGKFGVAQILWEWANLLVLYVRMGSPTPHNICASFVIFLKSVEQWLGDHARELIITFVLNPFFLEFPL